VTPFRRLVGLLAGHRRLMAAGALLGFLAVGSNVALLAMSAYLISRAALVTNVADIALAITAVRVLAIARAAFRYLERSVTHRATFDILADLRVWFFASIEPIAPAALAGQRRGDLLGRIVADIDTLEDFYVRVLVPPIVAAAVVAFASLLLGILDPVLGLALVAFMGLTGVLLPVVGRRLARRPAMSLVETRGELRATVVDELAGMADLVALDRTAWHRDRLLALGSASDEALTDLAWIRGWTTALAATLAGLASVTVLGIGAALVDAGRIDGVFLAVLPLTALAAFEVIGPLAQAVSLQDANESAARRLFELTDAPAAVIEPPAPRSASHRIGATTTNTVAMLPTPPAIEFRDVSFRYGSDEPLVLHGCSLTVPAGTSLAVVGPSGSGKTTLVNLLARFWDPGAGEVRIGDRDIRAQRADDVRALLTVVEQDVHLFDATIRDNLAVADADVTDGRIAEACRIAGVHDAIVALPAGYETRVGEGGMLLSGGERQRLAIARAVIKDAPVIVLDEATANLDIGTERDVLAAMRGWMEGRTTLVITHREAVASAMDRTVRLDAGRIVGQARPDR
jgi:ATP-binding cassette, subfamily C, bacterial CydC